MKIKGKSSAKKSSSSKKRNLKANAKREKSECKAAKKVAKPSAFSMCMRVSDAVEAIDIESVYTEIDQNYVSKLLDFLRDENGGVRHVSTHAEFIKVYQLIIHHCDN